MRTFDALVSSTKTFVTSAQRILSPRAKVFICSTINTFVIYLEGSLENPRKRMESREKSFSETSFHLRINGAEK